LAGGGDHLTIRLNSATQHVSGLSSLLRTLQAAVRDAAQKTEAGAKMLAAQPAPVMGVTVRGGAGRPLELAFHFSGPDGIAIAELDAAAFGAFMSELAAALKITPQRTLWATPLRPLIRSAGDNERMRLFLEDMSRIGGVEISWGGRMVALSEGRVESTSG